MKKILGLDLGTTSIGWAYVKEAANAEDNKHAIILASGVRVVPLSTDESNNYEKGQPSTLNADRTLKRSMRRNLDRYQDRRDQLIALLRKESWIKEDSLLAEEGKGSGYELWALRARAASEKLSLHELSRVLLAINKKRGYKSSRKSKDEGDGEAVDGMAVARVLYEREITPGQLVLERLEAGKKQQPDFYRSDLKAEAVAIWEAQRAYYPEQLSYALLEEINDKNSKQTWAIMAKALDLVGPKEKGSAFDKKLALYRERVKALSEQVGLEALARMMADINQQIVGSSGYLGKISDRSKQLIIKKQTVGQHLYAQLQKDRHQPLKGQVFYRQDYLDEFEQIWECQAKHHSQLSPALKEEIRDMVIFYQRKLKSQKGLIAICELERKKKEIEQDGKPRSITIGPKVAPRSSPIFQEFRLWQDLNHLRIYHKESEQLVELELEHKQMLFDELLWKEKLSLTEVCRLLGLKPKEHTLSLEEGLKGHETNTQLLKAYQRIIDHSGHELELKKLKSSAEKKTKLAELFKGLGINPAILEFDSRLPWKELEQQPYFQLWHLLYSFEEDPMDPSSKKKFLAKLQERFGFAPEYGQLLYQVVFPAAYGSLSTKAMLKILVELREGVRYDQACALAGYRHSAYLSKEENAERILADALELLPRNSLRNPVVEKILNQLVHVVNGLITEYGRPDEIRIELARELKKNAKERAEMTQSINRSTREADDIRTKLRQMHPFNEGVRITRKDVIKYRLWQELAPLGHKTLYSQTYIPLKRLFDKDFDVEHILPQSRISDDSFSNKTLELRSINHEKGDRTAYEYMRDKHGEESPELKAYEDQVASLAEAGRLSLSKKKKLLLLNKDIPDGFVERDLRNTQYIARKAQELLRQVCREVVPTSGSITERLRRDWQLVDVLKELNWEKYDALGLTEHETDKDGRKVKVIKDWSKRNDHRHHAMDAITVAFTKRQHIQYLNYQNARKEEGHKEHKSISGLADSLLYHNAQKQLLFRPPMPIPALRQAVKESLQGILVSFKAKNKVLTRNVNKIKRGDGELAKVELTPRGPLHKETIYGQRLRYASKLEKVGSKMDEANIALVANKREREALAQRLAEFGGDPKKAFTGQNSLAKNPIWLDEHQSQALPEKLKLVWQEPYYTIRKPIGPDLKLEKVVDVGVRRILEARLAEFGGKPKEAFANLEENPIWLNEEAGIALKRVRIEGISQAMALNQKHDHHGQPITDAQGHTRLSSFVSGGNNHHVAIYKDAKGKLQEQVVSFFNAVERLKQKQPLVDKQYRAGEGWQFLFTLKQNECFVFPSEGFNPQEMDLMDPKQAALISPHLFRVQKIATKDYVFRHHLETQLLDLRETHGLIWKRIQNPGKLEGVVKVRINHLGRVVQVGEY